jgi:hypothetical protein
VVVGVGMIGTTARGIVLAIGGAPGPGRGGDL